MDRAAHDLALILKTFMDNMNTEASLATYYKKNIQAIELIKSKDPLVYENLIDAFAARKEEILALPPTSSLSDS
mgnify:CR=1 FL=1